MWSAGDDFIVLKALPGTTVGKQYKITAIYLQGTFNYYSYIGDDNNFYDALESIFEANVSKPWVIPSGWHYYQPTGIYGSHLRVDEPKQPMKKNLRCRCGAKHVGVKDEQLELHSYFCDLVTGEEST